MNTDRARAKKGQLVLIWLLAFRNSLADRAAYRGDFFIGFLVTVLFEMVTPLVTVLLYRTSGGTGFPGWTMQEALLIQAVFLVSRGIAFPFFFAMVWTVHQLVREGNFELILLKPRSPLLVCMTRSINIQAFGRLFGGLTLALWVLRGLPAVSPAQYALFLALLALSLLVLFGFALAMAATLFVWVGNSRLMELMEALFLFGQYPANIFSGGFQLLITVVIPISMIAVFPAQALLGKDMPLLLPAIPVCLIFAAAGLLFWKHMIRRYSGAGG
jgi:ABC-2 type transport system permease protein